MRIPTLRGVQHRCETSLVESCQSSLEGAAGAVICAYSVGFQDKVEKGCNVRGQGEVDGPKTSQNKPSSHGEAPFNFDG